jgi:hypothetical protein
VSGVPRAAAQLVAALAYGERVAQRRAQEGIALASDGRRRKHQEHVAGKEGRSADLLEARAEELGSLEAQAAFRPFFDAFFEHTVPSDWLELQVFHYVGDAMVRDFAEVLMPLLDPVSAEVVRRTTERDEEEAFSLDEVTTGLDEDPGAADRVAAYARRVIGEALTQTRRAATQTQALRELLGGPHAEKRLILDLLDRHRRRLDRLGIEPVEEE